MNQWRPGLRPENSSAPQETQGRRLGGLPGTPAHSADGSLIRKYPRRHSAVCGRSLQSGEAHCAACGGQTPAAPDAEKDRLGERGGNLPLRRLAQQRRTRLRKVAVARWKGRCSRPVPGEAASCSLARAVCAPRPARLSVAAADGQPTATKERADTLARVCAATSDFPLGSSTLHRGRCVSGVRRGLARFAARPCTNCPSPPARNSRPHSTGATATVAFRLPGKWEL
ncbi:uncharacterized protein Tco025E_10228 [Trypanosoma conorhini]|uniref:Uncharacterized protein n=1 Tax=Trypanosoma conorhini TaxID=83891 RepID=A0A3R7MTK0_9TRYP|nr:uncharacterized protein Tco025E_10228 [Trypanosoma conorhini]RNE95027.1 hypothetical protein Tco025E_10228 [Trypanosoma conorhini]